MFIYNVTIKVNSHIASAWKDWMDREHLPEVMKTGCFEKYQFVKLLETDENEGITYAVQYYTDSLSRYEVYINQFASLLRQKSFDKWSDNFIAFRSLMEIIG